MDGGGQDIFAGVYTMATSPLQVMSFSQYVTVYEIIKLQCKEGSGETNSSHSQRQCRAAIDLYLTKPPSGNNCFVSSSSSLAKVSLPEISYVGAQWCPCLRWKKSVVNFNYFSAIHTYQKWKGADLNLSLSENCD